MTKKKAAKREQEKRGPGAPSKELKVDYDQIEDMAALGLTRKEIALLAGVGRTKLWTESKQDPELAAALEKGRARMTASIRRSIYDEAINKRNMTGLIWLSKNELNWTDKQQHSDPEGNSPFVARVVFVKPGDDKKKK